MKSVGNEVDVLSYTIWDEIPESLFEWEWWYIQNIRLYTYLTNIVFSRVTELSITWAFNKLHTG